MKAVSVKSAVRRSLLALCAGAALFGAAAGPAVAADARGADRVRQQQQPMPAPAPAPQAAEAPPRQAPQVRSNPRQAPGAQQGAAPQMRPYRGGGNNDTRTYNRAGDRVIVGPPRGRQGPDARIVPPSRAYVQRPPRYVPSLPHGHRRYDWRGSPYYYGGGHWYRPYQNRYVIVGAPVGLFVNYLPSYHSTMWIGGTRYYYADDVYYTYEPMRRGYVVASSPYGDRDEEYEDEQGEETRDQDLFIYPMRGQSEQQQSDDRYECHRWAVKETHYDPTDSQYDRDDRSDYDRAMSACLTGRGYSVK
jgi:hypothetical protein